MLLSIANWVRLTSFLKKQVSLTFFDNLHIYDEALLLWKRNDLKQYAYVDHDALRRCNMGLFDW